MQWCNIFRDKLNTTTPLSLTLYTFSYLTAWNVIVEPETVGRQKTEGHFQSEAKPCLCHSEGRPGKQNKTKAKQSYIATITLITYVSPRISCYRISYITIQYSNIGMAPYFIWLRFAIKVFCPAGTVWMMCV